MARSRQCIDLHRACAIDQAEYRWSEKDAASMLGVQSGRALPQRGHHAPQRNPILKKNAPGEGRVLQVLQLKQGRSGNESLRVAPVAGGDA